MRKDHTPASTSFDLAAIVMRSCIRALSIMKRIALLAGIALLTGLLTADAAIGKSPQTPAGETKRIDVRKLEVGRPIEREMKGGEEHLYEIALESGYYLDAVVEQRGIDVAVTVIAPDGRQLMVVDSPNGSQGPEPVKLIAEASGNYRLNVRSLEKNAPAGRYEIKVSELRAATDRDIQLAEADRLNKEVEGLALSGKYDAAMPLCERAIAIREKLLGTEHIDVAESLDNLAYLYKGKGEYAKAEPLYQRSLAILEKALGQEHTLVAISLNNLAVLYDSKGDYAKAEPPYHRSLAILEKVLGPEHPNVATALSNLALLYQNKGEYLKAEPLYQRSLSIKEKALGPEHVDVAIPLNNLALLYQVEGDYVRAEPLYQRSLSIKEKALGPEHIDVAISLNNLGSLYQNKGDYVRAEALYQRSLSIREKLLGPEHVDVATSLNNLGNLYQLKGDYAKAEPLYQRALAIWEKALGSDHPRVATSLNNLASLYADKGDYAKAEPLYQRSLAIREKALGPDHPDVASSLNSVASLYADKGDYAKAEPLFERSLAIFEKILGQDHPDFANSLNSLAVLHQQKGDYAKAKPLYQRSLAILEKALGSDHPRIAIALNNLGNLYTAQSNPAEALAFITRAVAVTERNIASNIVTGSERRKLAYLAIASGETNDVISLNTLSLPQSLEATRLALFAVLSRKGRALDAMTDSTATLRRRASVDDRKLLDRLASARSRLAVLTLRGPGREGVEQHKANIKSLEDEVEDVETKVSERSLEFRAQLTPINLENVQKAVSPHSALVEFASYRPFNAKAAKREERYGKPRYVSYVLRNQGDPSWVELGDTKEIDDKIDAFRKALRNKRSRDVKRLARQVDSLVMQPVRRLLGKTRRVLLSPDGALNLIPFAALVDDHNQYLVRRYSFTYLSSGRDLLRLQTKVQSKTAKMVVADPDFGEKRSNEADATRGSELDQLYFNPLKATEEEAHELKRLFPDATVLTGGQATEAALKAADRPAILHVATHGFFLDELAQVQAGDDKERTRIVRLKRVGASAATDNDPAKLINPLLRSGLGLAGANTGITKDGNDGILTALEAAGLDLWGTKLVVLSACDTGVGKVVSGDGVYGLRRALVLAGSESQMISLWPVSDTGTRDLMIDYYKRLRDGEGRSEALRLAQLEMLRDPKRRHPFYWASFIQSGEWANLDGKR